jgi:hypothetical protein
VFALELPDRIRLEVQSSIGQTVALFLCDGEILYYKERDAEVPTVIPLNGFAPLTNIRGRLCRRRACLRARRLVLDRCHHPAGGKVQLEVLGKGQKVRQVLLPENRPRALVVARRGGPGRSRVPLAQGRAAPDRTRRQSHAEARGGRGRHQPDLSAHWLTSLWRRYRCPDLIMRALDRFRRRRCTRRLLVGTERSGCRINDVDLIAASTAIGIVAQFCTAK